MNQRYSVTNRAWVPIQNVTTKRIVTENIVPVSTQPGTNSKEASKRRLARQIQKSLTDSRRASEGREEGP